MPDRDKVIKGLQESAAYFRSSFDAMYGTVACEKFRNWTDAIEQAIAMLKAQEPIAPIQGADDQDEDIFCCGSCGAVVGETFLGPPGECEVRYNYCQECGRAVKWDA